jgi:hypothetical protein
MVITIANRNYAYMFVAVLAAVVIGGYGLSYFGVLPEVQPTELAGYVVTEAGEVAVTPYVITSYTFTVLDKLNPDSTFGANDVYGKLYPEDEFDWDAAALDSQTTYATATGKITFSGDAAKSGNCYDSLFYQGDGGTNLYADLGTYCIPHFTDAAATWSEDEQVFLLKEGTFKEGALDNIEGNGTGTVVTAWDESGDVVTLDKSETIVEGTNKWEFELGNTVSGSCLKDVVIEFYESDSDQFTDIDDIQGIYLSNKDASGVDLPDGNLKDDFVNGNPLEIMSDDDMCSGDGGTVVLTLEFETSEADMGTGTLVMAIDDLGSKDARDLDKDKRASAETVSIKIQD